MKKKTTKKLPKKGDPVLRNSKGEVRQRKPGGGRKAIVLDDEQVTELSRRGWKIKEIAAFFKVSVDVIENKYRAALDRGEDIGNGELRDAQHRLAVNCLNPTMLIWLGKQKLGQADKLEVNPDGVRGFVFVPPKPKEEV